MSILLASLSRRRTLALTGGALLAAAAIPSLAQDASTPTAASPAGTAPVPRQAKADLPTKELEEIFQTTGEIDDDGVFSIELGRKDLEVTGPMGLPFTSSFQMHHEFFIQATDDGSAIINGDMAMLAEELNPVIDAALANGLVFQSEHQHFFGLDPQIYHMHFRGTGDPVELAKAVMAAIAKTGTPLPQKQPEDPKTPLDQDKLADILGGDAKVGDEGVVTVNVKRKEDFTLGGTSIAPSLNITTAVVFMPITKGKHAGKTAVAPDFAMLGAEVNKVIAAARDGGLEIHCLYNQETEEDPQLYFAHALAIGDAEDLAQKVRAALDLTNSEFSK